MKKLAVKNLAACLLALLLCLLPAYAQATEAADETGTEVTAEVTEEVTAELPQELTEEVTEELTEEEKYPSEPLVIDNTVKLTLDSHSAIFHGTEITTDVAPFAVNGTTMLPLRFIAQEILDAEVVWDNETNLVRVKKPNYTITVDLTNGKFYADGQPYKMSVKPMVVDNRTLVPLRLLTELMNCEVQYFAADKSIIITLPEILTVEPPVAQITYLPATAGQKIEFTDQSFDPAGYELTEREWQVIDADGVTKTGPSLYWLFYQRQGGDYTINYRVKNAYGLWSEQITTEYYLAENLPPQITELTAPETRVDIGQTLNISHEFANEDWEEIAVCAYTYTWEDEKGNLQTKTGCPAAFFAPGEYTVSLRLQDAFGQWSETAELIFEVSDKVLATEAEYRFNHLNRGELYLNMDNENFTQLSEATTDKFTLGSVTLIDSNSPEKVTAPGLLYKDTAGGQISLHYHHLNNSAQPLKFLVIAHNETAAPISFTVGKQGFAGPSGDPMQVGYIENQNYLSSTATGTAYTLQPGEKMLLNPGQNLPVKPGALQSALIDLQADGNLTLAVAAMSDGADFNTYTALPTHAAVGPQTRGTYQQAAYNIDLTLGDEPQKVMIGYPDSFVDKIENYLLTGKDVLSDTAACNKGNYGLVQKFTLTAETRTGVLLNPRGSIYRGAVLWNGELCLVSASGQIKTQRESAVLGVIEAGETAEITYITPDGSDSPVLLVSIPEEFWPEY